MDNKITYALELMVQEFANRPGLFGLLETAGKRHGWTPVMIANMKAVANHAEAVLAEIKAAK